MDQALYDLAYRFRNSKLWKTIYEDELFAVELKGRQIGYCSLMGRSGEHMALGLYIGDAGFSSYRKLVSYSTDNRGDAQNPVDLLTQDCIQCSIEQRDQFSPEELAEIKAYCKASGTPFRAPYPQFARFYPYCVPWHITSKSDWDSIGTALTVLEKMGEFLQSHSKEELGLRPIVADMEGEKYLESDVWQEDLFSAPPSRDPREDVTIPLYSLKKGELSMRRIPLPPFRETNLLPPDHFNEVAVARLMKLKKAGDMQCDVLRAPEPVDGEPPYVPAVLLALELDEGTILQPVMPKGPQYDPNEMLEGFIASLLSSGIYPRRIMVRTDETAVLLKPLCQRARIELAEGQELDELDEAADQIWEEQENGYYLEEIIRMLELMNLDQIRQFSAEMLKQLLETEGLLPDQLKEKIRMALLK
ncbi:MAG: hypothetical protein IKH57_00815 [Clostridia bacterium]|nr:hypothetical protein [Clostridia bacterium]